MHGWAGQLEQCCWQACSCMLEHEHEQDCSWLDERTDLNNVVGTIMINQQPCSYMIEHIVREWWNNKIEQRCHNNHELGCCIKSGFACSNKREQHLSIRQAVYNMLTHDWTILLFYQPCSIMLTVLLQGCWTNNPVIAWIFLRVYTWKSSSSDISKYNQRKNTYSCLN